MYGWEWVSRRNYYTHQMHPKWIVQFHLPSTQVPSQTQPVRGPVQLLHHQCPLTSDLSWKGWKGSKALGPWRKLLFGKMFSSCFFLYSIEFLCICIYTNVCDLNLILIQGQPRWEPLTYAVQRGMVELAYYEPVGNTISVGCWTTLFNVPNKHLNSYHLSLKLIIIVHIIACHPFVQPIYPSWWFPTWLKKICLSNWIIFPRRGKLFFKKKWNHHL